MVGATLVMLFGVLALSQYAVAQVDEIVVTTRKKSESLQELPIAVGVIICKSMRAESRLPSRYRGAVRVPMFSK